jgi:hypothetical protein
MTVTNSSVASAIGVRFCSVAVAAFTADHNNPLTTLLVTTLPVSAGPVSVPFRHPALAASRPMSPQVMS